MIRNPAGDEQDQNDLGKQSCSSPWGTHSMPLFITTLGSVYLPRDTEGPNVLMQAGITRLSLQSQRLSCWVAKAA